MSENKILKIDSTIRDSLEFYDKNREKYRDFFNKIKFVKFVDNNNTIDDIIFYDENKNIILESSYEIMSVFLPKTHMWKWSWAIPTIPKKYTFVSRKILEYAFNLDHIKELPLRANFTNSKIKIMNNLQLDIHIAISSYIGKQPLVFKFYNKFNNSFSEEQQNNNIDNTNENTTGVKNDSSDENIIGDEEYQEIIKYSESNDDINEDYMIMYFYILDYDNIK